MVPASDDHKDTPEVDSSASTKERKSSRLTPMPGYLMHWWTPLAIAEGLLRWPLILAIFWGGQPHWPSSEAMKLCVTIVGAGLAFSAWQQRSHDNAIREEERTKAQQQFEQELRDREQDRLDKQHQFDVEREERERNRLEQIERDEYWKRREQAYSLLSSNNPNIRLGAIELLVELGDIANESKAENTAKTQEFLQHIVTTLCNQVRYEGLSIDADGTLEQHAYLQGQIIQKLLKRANNSSTNNRSNGWATCTIDLSHSILNTEIQIHNTTIKQPLILTGTTFNKPVSITYSLVDELHWTNSHFNYLKVSNSSLTIDSFPEEMNDAEFSHTAFYSRSDNADATMTLTLTDAKSDYKHINTITFKQDCSFNSPLLIQTNSCTNDPNLSSERIRFQNCNFTTTEITGSMFNADLRFETCTFNTSLNIHDLLYELGAVTEHDCEIIGCERPYLDCLENWNIAFPHHTKTRTAFIIFSNCTFPNEITEKILIKGIICCCEIGDIINHELISFINSRTRDEKEITIEFTESYLDEGSTYIPKVYP